MRSSMEASENEQLKVLMAGFRGQNLDESDFASADVRMRLVTDFQDAGLTQALPLAYAPDAINRYWDTRPTAVITRITQLMGIAGNFISGLVLDFAQGKLKDNEVKRAIQLRDIVTSLGPAYIKLGQALSIRPDILSPAAMNELQKLCDKVPSFDSAVAMQVINDELGAPWYEIYADLTPEPIAAASLGQVYRGRLKTGEEVAVKVQRPGVLETVTVDLYIIRKIGLFLRRFPQVTTDAVALLDEWAARFFDELDYVKEGQNATLFAQQMAADLPQVVVPSTYSELTSRRVLTVSWLDGEKLSQSKADNVGDLVNIGVICYLKQLLDTGFFHADPHPGNLIRTPDGRLAILDFGLMTQVDDDIKFGMIEAISHLIHRDYEAIVQDFVTLQFIPPGTDLKPILPVLAKVFDQALEGGGAKNINFQELAADLAQITFDYPFRIPPYFALIIRAIGVLEGIALVGDPEFALVDEAYPYIAKRLLTDESPRLQASLRYMVYGKQGIFDADRLIDLLNAFESFAVASQSSRGDMDQQAAAAAAAAAANGNGRSSSSRPSSSGSTLDSQGRLREAMRFIFSPEGSFFRTFLLDEVVKSIDALSREQLVLLVQRLGLSGARLPVLLPGARHVSVPLSPHLSVEDRQVVDNVVKIVNFLTKGSLSGPRPDASLVLELLPVLPTVAREVLPQVTSQLISRISARAVRELYT
ncbi:ABC1 family-domain-containing protein [Scenedesmus sp. NREL 46B-D3]|nr:ABC1 family-domain-containing protein [Scenedesmus sp. NREL 46B-D3]